MIMTLERAGDIVLALHLLEIIRHGEMLVESDSVRERDWGKFCEQALDLADCVKEGLLNDQVKEA